jgi:N-acetylmuramic acid 6-phosphate etherase
MLPITLGMQRPKKLVLGVEGGGTKTEWILVQASMNGTTELLQRGELPAANLRLISDESLRQFLRVLPGEPTHAGVFLAGCATEADRERLRKVVHGMWPEARIRVGSDRESGFAACFGRGDGIAVIAGTGSAVTGRRADRVEKAGGWGQLLGDTGGGYYLGMRALRHVLQTYDLHQTVSELGMRILQALALNRLEDLVAWVGSADKMSVAKLAPVVFTAAERGDAEMIECIAQGARTLAQYTVAVARRLEFSSPAVRCTGGLFVHHEQYCDRFREAVQAELPGAQVGVCGESGALGAALLAAEEETLQPKTRSEPVAAEVQAELAGAATEQINPRSIDLDRRTTEEMVDLFVAEEETVIEALRSARDSICSAVDLVATQLAAGGRLFYCGAGTSGRLGVLDASEIPPTFGASPDLVQAIIAGGVQALHRAVEGAEDSAQLGALSLTGRGFTPDDVLCGITASGRTPFVLGALAHAKEIGGKTMLLTCNPARRRDAAQHWDVEIDLATGPELITGSTRLKAGTATKLVLNTISTCAMVRLGKVRGNLMIDLSVTNTKLRDRAIRVVSEIRGITYEAAREALERVGWNVRKAIR